MLYAVSFSIFCVGAGVFSLRDTLFPAPTCLDMKQNGFESGVDCGGVCSLRCTEEVIPYTVLWSKAVPSGKGLYDLVALVSNKNIDNASHEVGFTFTVYDTKGVPLGSLSGSTTVPLDGKFPLILQNIPLDTAIGSVSATLRDGPHYLVKEKPTSPTIRVLRKEYDVDSISRVFATLANTKQIEIRDLPVRVLLFDAQDNVFAVGQTIVPILTKEEVKEVSFTWRERFSRKPSRIEVYPIFNPFDAGDY